MPQKVLLVQPPFIQLNTPYPATAYLKGFLNTKDISSCQIDLAIETILELFSKQGLAQLFNAVEEVVDREDISDNAFKILASKNEYEKTVDPIISFLQGKNSLLAHRICSRNYLPEASRFGQLADMEWAFGSMGTQDKAKHLATLFLEDISDFIIETADPDFGFSRYAEKLGMAAHNFDELYQALTEYDTYIDGIYLEVLREKITHEKPTLVALTVPFPGNLYAALKCGQMIKDEFEGVKVAMGGGYPNTELRSLKEARVFEFVDFITLDDGEAPMLNLIEYLEGELPIEKLKRTFALNDNKVEYLNGSEIPDFKQRDVGTPDYEGLNLDQYISVIEVANPMHRLWNDGAWLKMTLAHGCYWAKCTFCDVSLDYIKVYEATTAKILVDRMEELMQQTGRNGFHFVDEAAPPALMRELAIEILKRDLTVTWWTNIRFEKNFTADLCKLLAASGCIAISGGLEVASDRLLELIDKGVTVSQVARVTRNFTENGIMVHAYLMYAYPTQTEQETIDSLEMVRQIFEAGIVQSGFWHRFAMTAHSPVGLDPKAFGVLEWDQKEGSFANNEVPYIDSTGIEHAKFSEGLRTSLFNYMHNQCFEFDLQDWFEFEIPETTIDADFIANALATNEPENLGDNKKVIWLGRVTSVNEVDSKWSEISFISNSGIEFLKLKGNHASWLEQLLSWSMASNEKTMKLGQWKSHYESAGLGNFEKFISSKVFKCLRELGLVIV
ncbi:MAG: radical SAM protein [Bacteroidia bacterium]